MKTKFTLSILLSVISSAHATSVNLLELPLSDKTTEVYSVEQKEPCSFKGVSDIIIPKFDGPKDDFVRDTLDNIQKKINWKINEKYISEDKIWFNLSGAENVTFSFSYVNCKLKKEVSFNKTNLVIDSIDIEYDNTLSPPVVKNFILKDAAKNEIHRFSPTQLEGQIGSHEFILGPVVNITTNIRLNNEKTFKRHNPVIEPVPGFMLRYGPLFINREGAGSLAFSKDKLSILAVAILKGEDYKRSGMRERNDGIYLGGILKYDLVEFSYSNDFFKDKGYHMKLALSPSFHHLTKWSFKPQVYVQYWDNQYMDYYFGVNQDESLNTGLRTYKGKHTLNYATSLEVNHFVDKWILIGLFGGKLYGKEVYTSPTVTKKFEFRTVLGVLYKIF